MAGANFHFLKFRTMKAGADPSTHQEYLADLINNGDTNDDAPMIKLDDHNPQIIPFGKLIRKTYLDELPQLLNVLRGDMSLVGPRPPIPYEVAEYRMWHNGRFNTIPGMTGLWQVSGKNRLTFQGNDPSGYSVLPKPLIFIGHQNNLHDSVCHSLRAYYPSTGGKYFRGRGELKCLM